MNPHQKNKVDISSLSPDEQRLFRLYGKLPNKKDLLQNKLKERKYFDSGDYALSQAGKASDAGVTQVGREHPNPDNIPHLNSSSPHGNGAPGGTGTPNLPPPGTQGASATGGPGGGGPTSGSPVKESSFLHREQSIDDQPGEASPGKSDGKKSGVDGSSPMSPPRHGEGMPIRGPGS